MDEKRDQPGTQSDSHPGPAGEPGRDAPEGEISAGPTGTSAMSATLSRRKLLAIGGAGLVGAAGAASVIRAGRADARPAGTRVAKAEALPQVPRRALGKTGAKIPILLFGGAVSLDRRFDPKIAEAMRFGVDYIDAADCYGGGSCELAVSNYLKKAKAAGKVWITSKSDRHDPEGFEQTLGRSLKKLGTSNVDMYFLHALKNTKYMSKDLKQTVERLKKSGKIKYFGFSCHNGNVAELLTKAAELGWFDAIMFRYNFRQYGDTELNKAIDKAHKAGIGLIAMKTQSSEVSFRKQWRKFQRSGKWNKYQAVLKAVWADERITAAVSHMDTLDKVRENVAAAVNKEKLSTAEWDALDRYARDTRSAACDGCDHICGAHVDAPVQIGDTMRYLMYHDVYGEPDKAKGLFRALPRAAQQLAGVDFRAAEAACPHGVAIAEHMARATRLFTV